MYPSRFPTCQHGRRFKLHQFCCCRYFCPDRWISYGFVKYDMIVRDWFPCLRMVEIFPEWNAHIKLLHQVIDWFLMDSRKVEEMRPPDFKFQPAGGDLAPCHIVNTCGMAEMMQRCHVASWRPEDALGCFRPDIAPCTLHQLKQEFLSLQAGFYFPFGFHRMQFIRNWRVIPLVTTGDCKQKDQRLLFLKIHLALLNFSMFQKPRIEIPGRRRREGKINGRLNGSSVDGFIVPCYWIDIKCEWNVP